MLVGDGLTLGAGRQQLLGATDNHRRHSIPGPAVVQGVMLASELCLARSWQQEPKLAERKPCQSFHGLAVHSSV